jgi:hypothetical protein
LLPASDQVGDERFSQRIVQPFKPRRFLFNLAEVRGCPPVEGCDQPREQLLISRRLLHGPGNLCEVLLPRHPRNEPAFPQLDGLGCLLQDGDLGCEFVRGFTTFVGKIRPGLARIPCQSSQKARLDTSSRFVVTWPRSQ